MAKKKLYGAAAKAHLKRLAKSKKRRAGKRKRKAVAHKVIRRRRKKVAMKSARRNPRRRSKARRSSRRRRNPSAAAMHSRASLALSNKPRRKKRKGGGSRKRKHRGGRPGTAKSVLRARRTIRNRYMTATGKATLRRFRMRSNPGMGMFKDLAMSILPVAGSLYGSRFLSAKVSQWMPASVSGAIPAKYQGSAMALLLMGVTHFATKKVAALGKYRTAMLIGTGINLIDNVAKAFLPADVSKQIGLGDIYDDGLSEYVGVGEYLEMGATPIDDNITLSDYIEMGQMEEELGVEEELGAQEELGGFGQKYLGGVSQGDMLKNIPQRPMLAAIPQRSFTKEIPHAGPGYDKADVLYGGIFGGGF